MWHCRHSKPLLDSNSDQTSVDSQCKPSLDSNSNPNFAAFRIQNSNLCLQALSAAERTRDWEAADALLAAMKNRDIRWFKLSNKQLLGLIYLFSRVVYDNIICTHTYIYIYDMVYTWLGGGRCTTSSHEKPRYQVRFKHSKVEMYDVYIGYIFLILDPTQLTPTPLSYPPPPLPLLCIHKK
jgi:hypothetical protein